MLKNCSSYPQSIQFTFQHKVYLTYEEARRALINKNLLPAEPAVVFYYDGNPRVEHVMLGIGNQHDSTKPLIITESINQADAEEIMSVIGTEKVEIPVYNENGDVTYITDVTSAINYLAQAVDPGNFIGEFDYSNDIARILEEYYVPNYQIGIYTYRIHFTDEEDSIFQLELFTDENDQTVQVFTNEEGRKLTRKFINNRWTALQEVIPFTKEYLSEIVGGTCIDDTVVSLKSTWSSKHIVDYIKDHEITADRIIVEYNDPISGQEMVSNQQQFNAQMVADVHELKENIDFLEDAMPDWSSI